MNHLNVQEIVKQTREDFEKRRDERKSLELQWRLNMNFLAGNQYADISPRGDIEDQGKQYFWQEREVSCSVRANMRRSEICWWYFV